MKYTILLFLFAILRSASAQTYFLNGDATASGGDCYALTSEVNNQNGTVWYAEQINLLQPFSIQFRMNLGSINDLGADGICFVLQTVGTSAIGANGGGMGYSNFGTSLGIEFDTWQNGEYNDPGYDHIAIEKNGDIDHNTSNNIAGPVQADVFDQDIEDGEDHVVRIEWEPTLERIRVYFDCVFRLQGDIDLIDTIFGGNALVYWGFTAATGGAFNNQSVCLQPNILNVGNEIVICQGMQPVLGAGSSIDGIYNWSPPDFLSDTTSSSPTTSTPSDMTYTVSFTDLCGDSIVQEIFVNVETLEITATAQEIINCATNEVTIQMDSNIPLQTGFSVYDTDDNLITQGPSITNWTAGMPGVYVIEASMDSICFDVTEVNVFADFSTVILDAGQDIVLNCFAPNTLTNALSNTPDATINWFLNGAALNNDNTLQLLVHQAGEYWMTAVHPTSLCWSIDTMMVTLDFVQPTILIPIQDTLTCLHPSFEMQGVVITAAHEYAIQWNTDLDPAMIGAQTSSPTVHIPGYYEIVVNDNVNGCQGAVGLVIHAEDLEPIDPDLLKFPNVISPNADGLNNEWRVALLGDEEIQPVEIFKEFEMNIFDRWGKEVASLKTPTETWNATDASEGVYYYIVNYTLLCGSGTPSQVEGSVHVVR